MKPIGINKLEAFWKYYDDFELMHDARYVNKKQILKEINEEEIRVISILEHHYFLINSKTDSKQLVEGYRKVINEHKNKVTTQVLEHLKKGKRPEVEIEEKNLGLKSC